MTTRLERLMEKIENAKYSSKKANVTKLSSKSMYFITRLMPELSKIITLHSEILKTRKVIEKCNKLESNGYTIEIQEAVKSYLNSLFYEYNKLVPKFCEKYSYDETDSLTHIERQYISYIVSL